MWSLSRLSLACVRNIPHTPPRLTARCLSLSSARTGDGFQPINSVRSGSEELDSLIAGSYSSSDRIVTPVHDNTTVLGETLTNSYISPLTHSNPPTVNATDYISPFSSIERVDYTNLAEPTFQSLGLAHGWPSGWLQTFMEFMHIDLGLPWWQTIVGTTVCLRIFVLPFMIIAQKNMAHLNNHQPTLQKLQVEAALCSIRGEVDKEKFANDGLHNYMIEHKCHPARNMWPMIVNGICMTSMFFGLRGMTNAPVVSMTTGGAAWFKDLVAVDPTFILPLTAAGTIGLMMYLGADGLNLDTMPPIMKKILILMPIVSIPVMLSFPAALGVYWVTNNMISLVQSTIMKRPQVRDFLNIPEIIKWKPEDLPQNSFMEMLKREKAKQQQKEQQEQAARESNKLKIVEKDQKIRGALLEGFSQEDQQRLKQNAEKRLKQSERNN